jgi:hypothetical protein
MCVKFRLAFLLPLATLLACGSNPAATPPVSNYPSFSGDWRAYTTANPTSTPINGFVGVLSASGGTVSGSLIPFPYPTSPCLSIGTTPIPVAGTISSSGNMTITLPVAGGTATLNATLTSNLETLVSGTYQIVGGSCAMSAAPMQVAEIAPLNGTYTGTVSVLDSFGLPNPSTATNITAALTQSTAPNAEDMYPVTGTVTATGACALSFTLSANSFVWGGTLLAGDSSGSYSLAGSFDPTGTTSPVAVFSTLTSSSSCPYAGQYFDGTLTRQ